MFDQFITKQDLQSLTQEFHSMARELVFVLTLRMACMMVVGIAVSVALLNLFP